MSAVAPQHGRRPDVWRPSWAVTCAWAALVVAAVLSLALLWLVLDDLGTTGEKFDGLVAGIAATGLGVVAAVVAPWAWFALRGGRVAFVLGLASLSIAFVVWAVFGFWMPL